MWFVRLQVACASISSNNHFETNLERLGLLERRKCREFQASCIDRKTSLASKQFPSLPSASRNTVAGRMPSERQTSECLCCASSDVLLSSQPSSIAPFVTASTFCSLNDNSNFCLCMHVREHECIHACLFPTSSHPNFRICIRAYIYAYSVPKPNRACAESRP